jgi:hypothetical protein
VTVIPAPRRATRTGRYRARREAITVIQNFSAPISPIRDSASFR